MNSEELEQLQEDLDDLKTNDNSTKRIESYSSDNEMGSELFNQKSNPNETLYQISLLLKSEQKVIKRFKDKETGEIIDREVIEPIKGLRPLVNDEGYHRIMTWLRIAINKDSVLGNIKIEQYNNYMKDFLNDFSKFLIMHKSKFEMTEKNMFVIYESSYQFLRLWATRPINNLERISVSGGSISEVVGGADKEKPKKSMFNLGGLIKW